MTVAGPGTRPSHDDARLLGLYRRSIGLHRQRPRDAGTAPACLGQAALEQQS